MNISKKLYIQLVKYEWEKKPFITVTQYEGKSDDNQIVMTIDEIDFHYNVADDIYDTFQQHQIVELENKKRILFAKAQLDMNRVDGQIQSLLALESK
tara:strand:+ start:1777 stop:2067 length:291 start_codon:yes stop_codon:yes gene_type:complete